MSKSACSAFGIAQFGHFYQLRLFVTCYHHLAYTFARLNGLCLAAKVDEYDTHFATVVGIDRSRGVEYGKATLEGQTATRTDLRLVAGRQLDE